MLYAHQAMWVSELYHLPKEGREYSESGMQWSKWESSETETLEACKEWEQTNPEHPYAHFLILKRIPTQWLELWSFPADNTRVKEPNKLQLQLLYARTQKYSERKYSTRGADERIYIPQPNFAGFIRVYTFFFEKAFIIID